MHLSTPTSFWNRLGTWAASSADLADRRAFLQRRVALYARVLVSAMLVMGALDLASGWLLLATDSWESAPVISLWWTIGYVVLMLGFAATWFWARRGEPSAQLLELVEGACALAAVAACALGIASAHGWIATERLGSLALSGMVLCVAIILVLRAALVPSSAVRTLVIGIVAATMVGVGGFVGHNVPNAASSQDMLLPTAWEGAIVLGTWVLFFAFITSVNSRVIYGLQARVRHAMSVGQYTLEEKIGEGGMGVVYKARHAMLRRPTAIKLLPPDRAGDHAVRHFEQEVQQTSRLSHPNTVAIYDFGRTPEGIFYYVMEYLDGVNLEQLVEADGPQAPGRVIRILSQACHALAEAHQIGLVHRDVKPANILLVNHGGVADHVKLVDFGLVRQVDAEGRIDVTQTGKIEGTPMYTAPEALSAPADVDARADLYALGAVAYFLLTGKPVFEGRTAVEVLAKHLKVTPVTPSARLGRPLPADLEALVLRCLAKDPADRPQDAAELFRALRQCRDAGQWSLGDAQAWWSSQGATLTGQGGDSAHDRELAERLGAFAVA